MIRRSARPLRLLTIALSMVTLTASCSDDGDEAPDPLYGGVIKNQGTNPFFGALSGGGDPVAERVIEAAGSCGFQSYNSIPAGWKKVFVGDRGCAIWVPPDWVAAGEGTDSTTVQEDHKGLTGVASLRGSQAQGVGIVCTLKGVANWVFGNVEPYNRCTSIRELVFQEGIVEVDGSLYTKAVQLSSCVDGGSTYLDYLSVMIRGTSPLCEVLVAGFWMPEDKIEEQTCALTQIQQSARCPTDGRFCDAPECNADCKEMGRSGGSCTVSGDGDRCQCEASPP